MNNIIKNPFNQVGIKILLRWLINFNHPPKTFKKVYYMMGSYLYQQQNPFAFLFLIRANEFDIVESKGLLESSCKKSNVKYQHEILLRESFLIETLNNPCWYHCINISEMLMRFLSKIKTQKYSDVDNTHYVLGRVIYDIAVTREDRDEALQDLEMAKKCFQQIDSSDYRDTKYILWQIQKFNHRTINDNFYWFLLKEKLVAQAQVDVSDIVADEGMQHSRGPAT